MGVDFAADEAIVDDTDRATAKWRQGDVIDLRLISWLALPDSPLTAHAALATNSDDSDVAVLLAEAEALVVLTQTCDIVRTCRERPHVELARLVKLSEPSASEARRGARPRFAPVPGVGADAFVDLDVVVTAEKSMLARASRTLGLPSEADQRRFARGVGRAYSRFAFPDDLTVALRGLVGRIRDKHDRDSPEGRALGALEEIRITGSPSWSGDLIDTFLTFAPPTREVADTVLSQEEWDEIVDQWLRRAEPFGVIRSVDGSMIPLDEFTAREYVDSDPLDLDYLSWATASSRA